MQKYQTLRLVNLRVTTIALLTSMLALGLQACNAEAQNSITVENPQVRSTAAGQKVTGAFMVLKNTTATDIDLTTAKSDIASMTEIHESSMRNGMMEMNQVDKVTIPANGSAELKPGGFHIMLMGLNKQLNQGDKTALTLTFSDNSQQTIEASVVDVSE